MDRSKITFAQSYLKGMALEWFELDLLDTGDPANRLCWMDNWIAFIAELQSTFGPHNPVADAEHQLDHLQMKDGHCVTWYIVASTGWSHKSEATVTVPSGTTSTPVFWTG